MNGPAAQPHAELAASLRAAVRARGFERVPDTWRGGAPIAHFPSIDLAVVRFGPQPRWANVLFSREHPEGLTAQMSGTAGAVANVRFVGDVRDAAGVSVAWQPEADWSALPFPPLQGPPEAPRFVAPYPASLLKLMVAVGVGMVVEQGRCAWPDALEPMITLSDNDATDACVALLHATGGIALLHERLATCGLRALQLSGTTAAGGWRNADGAGVGRIHMTAWDTVRLLWLLDADAPPPPWLPAGTALLQPATCAHLRGVLQRQRLDHVLSSGSLRGQPGWVAGLPDAPTFAHKTGSTDHYASDAGIVQGDGAHYLVAVLTSLGARYAPPPPSVAPWQLAALGAAVHRLMVRQELALDHPHPGPLPPAGEGDSRAGPLPQAGEPDA